MEYGKSSLVCFQTDQAATLQVDSSDGSVPPQGPALPFPHQLPLPLIPTLTQTDAANSADPSQPPSVESDPNPGNEQSRKRRQSDDETTSDVDNPAPSPGVGTLDHITSVAGQGHSNPGGQVGHHPPPLPLPPPHFHPSPDNELIHESNSHLNPSIGVEETSTSTQGLDVTSPSSSSFSWILDVNYKNHVGTVITAERNENRIIIINKCVNEVFFQNFKWLSSVSLFK